MGKTFNYERAEQEANKIGLEFAHSNDVVKDMSRAYHVDFSNIRVHTDSAADNKVKAAGRDALAQGKDIFFGKGIFESSDPAAKGLVAHEFAHIMQQGAAMGGEMAVAESAPMGMAQGGFLDWFRKLFSRRKPEDKVSFASDPKQKAGSAIGQFWRNYSSGKHERIDPERVNLYDSLFEHIEKDEGKIELMKNGFLGNASGDVFADGLGLMRLERILQGSLGGNMSKEDIVQMFDKLLAGGRAALINQKKANGIEISAQDEAFVSNISPEENSEMDAQFESGFVQLKGLYLAQLRRLKEQYGTYITQMHPEDFISRLGPEFFDHTRLLQDCIQIMNGASKYFDFENNADDREFQTLTKYYNNAMQTLSAYIMTDTNTMGEKFIPGAEEMEILENLPYHSAALADEKGVGGPGFTEKEQKDYTKRVQSRFNKSSLKHRLFGRFKKK